MTHDETTSRRRFIATASAAAAVTIVPRHVLGGPGFVAPSDKVNVALIGAGGQGSPTPARCSRGRTAR
jgi:hypothetical protein